MSDPLGPIDKTNPNTPNSGINKTQLYILDINIKATYLSIITTGEHLFVCYLNQDFLNLIDTVLSFNSFYIKNCQWFGGALWAY